MEQKGKFKLYSSEEVLDMHFGKIGTPRRDDFERSVAASVHANEMAARNPYIPKNVSHPGTTLDEMRKANLPTPGQKPRSEPSRPCSTV